MYASGMGGPDLVISLDGPAEPLPPRRRWRGVVSSTVALVAAFALGVGVGYEWLDRDPPQPSPTAASGRAGVAIGARCSVQTGSALQLGVELVNHGPGSIVVSRPRLDLPIGGLAPTSMVWGTCGQLDADAWPGDGEQGAVEVPENTTLWLSGGFDVVEPDECPAPYPVLFTVAYTDTTGQVADLSFGFADLGDVSYSACENRLAPMGRG
jgi:hypothetical protein